MARRSSQHPTYVFTVAPVVDAVPAARRQVVSLVQELGLPMSDQTLETVELLAGEVIANAVLYTAAPCGVSVMRADERLRVEVTDADASLPSAVEAAPTDESGRGLLLVNALADAWGAQPEPPGKTTWFEITQEPSSDGSANDFADALPSPHTLAVVFHPKGEFLGISDRRLSHRRAHDSFSRPRARFLIATGTRRSVSCGQRVDGDE